MAHAPWFGRAIEIDDSGKMAESGEVVALDPDRLTRHAVCFGMTGSGKTGLCVTLLEELSAAGVPVIAIDPKGDMANLALAFSDHRAEDFAPWVDPSQADREGRTVEAHAAVIAERWRNGLAKHGVTAERIRAFTDGVDVTVFSPGSTAGVPVDLLGMLRAPDPRLREDAEGLTGLVSGTVSALLGLVDVQADPVKDPEHVVLARIVEDCWAAGQDLTLESLILKLVDPPFEKVGVFPVEMFFPRNDRMKLAMAFNGVVASPAFQVWSEGVPLDIDRLLEPHEGRTPVHVFTLAHLDDTQRMFFSAMLLEQVVAWSRRQPGSSTLRALVYFDEVMGFLPPHPKNPPTKRPVLTLMKQARAVGVGTMLVTQNPVDVDYAAMSNAGTWILGRLQTDQDRDRVLDGLSGATGDIDRKTLSGWLESLPSRTFVVQDVEEAEPFLLKSRWATSFLRGPLTRRELEQLDQDWQTRFGAASAVAAPQPAAAPAPASPSAAAPVEDDGLLDQPAPSPNDTPQRFLDPAVAFGARWADITDPVEQERREDGAIVWRPAVWARLSVTFDERDFEERREEHRLFFPIDGAVVPDSVEPPVEEGDLLRAPPAGVHRFHALPAGIDEPNELRALESRVRDEVERGETTQLFENAALKLKSRAGETREQFDARALKAAEDHADAGILKLKDKTDREVERLEKKRDALNRDIERATSEVGSRQASEMMNIAETAYSWFTGRRRSLNTAMSKRNQTRRATEKLASQQNELQQLLREIYDLDVGLQTEILAIQNASRLLTEETVERSIGLERTDIDLDEFAILWIPVTRPPLG
jgi:hypothetical protein